MHVSSSGHACILQKSETAPQPDNGVADLEFRRYHIPADGYNLLGRVAYMKEYFFSPTGEPDVPERKLWFEASKNLLQIASMLEVIRHRFTSRINILFTLILSCQILFQAKMRQPLSYISM